MASRFMFLPYLLQALAMGFDEFYFHHKRGLPQWEAYGHPIDTFSVLLCYGFLLVCPPSSSNVVLYTVLVSISCLVITKDEWVHQKFCSGMEQWIHSILFILHPVTLGLAGWGWMHKGTYSLFNVSFMIFIKFQLFISFCFMIYQFFYWRIRCTRETLRDQEHLKLTTQFTIN